MEENERKTVGKKQTFVELRGTGYNQEKNKEVQGVEVNKKETVKREL